MTEVVHVIHRCGLARRSLRKLTISEAELAERWWSGPSLYAAPVERIDTGNPQLLAAFVRDLSADRSWSNGSPRAALRRAANHWELQARWTSLRIKLRKLHGRTRPGAIHDTFVEESFEASLQHGALPLLKLDVGCPNPKA